MKSNENSGWTVEFAHTVTKQLDKLDPSIASRILDYLRRLETDLDPTSVAKPLKGSLSMLSRFRVGDYRVICKLDGESKLVLVLRLAIERKHIVSSFGSSRPFQITPAVKQMVLYPD